MEQCGIDVHKSQSQVCILDENGTVLLERRLRTSAEAFAALLGARERMRVLLEAGTESEWVARCLEELGHEVIVADPNFAAMYATRSRRVKTDLRDARTLAEAARLGAFRRAHRTSEPQRTVRNVLAARDALVESRTKLINVVRAMLRARGLRLRSGERKCFPERVRELRLEGQLQRTIEMLLETFEHLSGQIKAIEKELQAVTRNDARVGMLTTAPGIALLSAAAFVATIDDAARFQRAHQVASYFGLVPTEASSGEKQRRGHITRAGHRRMRCLLIQSALAAMRTKREDVRHLRDWAARIGARRGKRIAMVALARKLSGILWAMMRDGSEFDARTVEPGVNAEAA
jgi:transposase